MCSIKYLSFGIVHRADFAEFDLKSSFSAIRQMLRRDCRLPRRRLPRGSRAAAPSLLMDGAFGPRATVRRGMMRTVLPSRRTPPGSPKKTSFGGANRDRIKPNTSSAVGKQTLQFGKPFWGELFQLIGAWSS